MTLNARLEQAGFFVLDRVFAPRAMAELAQAIHQSACFQTYGVGRAGLRQVHQRIPEVQKFVEAAEIKQLAAQALPGAFLVRAIFFDKTPGANWKVPWHQDLAICVQEQGNAEGYSGWSRKEGCLHVHPPAAVLEGMIAIRIHLDDCGEDNGPLMVIPGSHAFGRLSQEEIAQTQKSRAVPCLVKAGGVVGMKPLLLHASSPAIKPGHRRVLHLEYASTPLPGGLKWQVAG